MSKIVFLKNKSEIYDGTFKQIGSNQVRITFDKIMPSNDVLLSGFNLVNEYNKCVQTIREDYKYLYRTYKDDQMTVELCNDGIEYAPETIPQPEPYEPTPEELEAVFQQNKTNKIALSKLMLAEFLQNITGFLLFYYNNMIHHSSPAAGDYVGEFFRFSYE